MATAAELLSVARAEVGTREQPMGSNRTKYGEWYGWNGVAWCAIFVSWCFNKVGLGSLRSAAVDDFLAGARSGRWGSFINKYGAIRKGDIGIMDYGDGGRTDHIVIVAEVYGNGSFKTIEGNWSDQVTSVVRNRSQIVGFLRPRYTDSRPSQNSVSMSVPAVKIYQAMLNKVLGNRIKPLKVDGIYGEATKAAVKRFQRFANDLSQLGGSPKRLAVDGIIGPSTLPVLHFWFVVSGTPKPSPAQQVPSGTPLLRVGVPDGDRVRMLQMSLNRAIGAKLKVDGVYGPATRRAVSIFQSSVGLSPDGIYGKNTANALKKRLS